MSGIMIVISVFCAAGGVLTVLGAVYETRVDRAGSAQPVRTRRADRRRKTDEGKRDQSGERPACCGDSCPGYGRTAGDWKTAGTAGGDPDPRLRVLRHGREHPRGGAGKAAGEQPPRAC